MIKAFFKLILFALGLLILIPMIMLLIGEGALLRRILSIPSSNEQTELVEPQPNETSSSSNEGDINISQNISIKGGEKTPRTVSNVVNLGSDAQNQIKLLDFKLTHNAQDYRGHKGLKITVKFKAEGLADENLYCMARFYDSSGEPVESHTNSRKYTSQGGNVFTGDWCVPQNDEQTIKVNLFLPYSELKKSSEEYLVDVSFLLYYDNVDYETIYRSKAKAFKLQ